MISTNNLMQLWNVATNTILATTVMLVEGMPTVSK